MTLCPECVDDLDTTREINLFRSWLTARKGQLLAEPDALSASIQGGDTQ